MKTTPGSPAGWDDAATSAGPVRLFEALVEGGSAGGRNPVNVRGLRSELPGGSRIMVESLVQLQMAVKRSIGRGHSGEWTFGDCRRFFPSHTLLKASCGRFSESDRRLKEACMLVKDA